MNPTRYDTLPHRKILMVDDDFFASQVIVRYCQDKCRWEVTLCTSVDEAINALTARPSYFDVVLTDVMMPHGRLDPTESHGGYEAGIALARFIRRHYPTLPIVGMSAAIDKGKWFLENGMFFLSKPTAAKELVDTIMVVTNQGKRGRKPNLFIVHGHNHKVLNELVDFLENTLKLGHPTILHELPEKGHTVISKFEEAAGEVDVVFVLLTKDDSGHALKSPRQSKKRARQNVIFELGYFYGKLGRTSGKVILIQDQDVELPSDLSGIITLQIYTDSIMYITPRLALELNEWVQTSS